MNAIILCAGMGTRLRPLTNNIPKCLVPVCGTPMVEKQIQLLHKAGITDITLISGYKAKCLDYLREEYKVEIVYNEKFDTCNNIYSLYLVRKKLGDTFIIEGDVFLSSYEFPAQPPKTSIYFSKWVENYKNEWALICNMQNQLTDIQIGNSGSGYIMSGISFWKKEDAQKINTKLEEIINHEEYTNLFWDHIILRLYKDLHIYIEPTIGIYEIDTVEDLHSVEEQLNTH